MQQLIAKKDVVPQVSVEPKLISPPYVASPWLYRGMESHAKSRYDALGGVGPNVNHQINNER